MATAESLAALPAPVQERLAEFINLAATATADEQMFVLTWLAATQKKTLSELAFREQAKLVEILGAVGLVLAAVTRADMEEDVA